MRPLLLLILCLALGATGWSQASPMTALPGVQAPKLTKVVKVRLVTTQGDLRIDVYPEAAPNASQRFVELVKAGFFDFTPIFRVVPNFVCQFGINWRTPHPEWKEKNFNDDPSYFRLERGTLAFAKAGPNTNSTQLFINFRDNSRLASDEGGHFSAFARVTEGQEVLDRFWVTGDPNMGLDQDKLWSEGESYLRSQTLQPPYILFAEVL